MAFKVEGHSQFDASEIQDGVRKIEDTFKRSFTEINSLVDLVGKGLNKLGAIADLVGRWTSAASEAESIQRKLAAAVGEQYERISDYNTALSRKLGIDDDDIAKAQVKLVALGVQTSKLEDATRATLGLASATGVELEAATKRVAKAFTDNADGAARLAETYRFAEEDALGFAGATRGLDTAWGDLEETLGGIITQSPAVQDAMRGMSDSLSDMADGIRSSGLQQHLDAIIRRLQLASHFGGGVGGILTSFAITGVLKEQGIDLDEAIAASDALRRGPTTGALAARIRRDLAPPPELTKRGKAERLTEDDLSGPARDLLLGASVVEQWEEEQEQIRAMRDLALEESRLNTEREIAANDIRFQAELAAFQERDRLRQSELRAEESFYTSLVNIGARGFAWLFGVIGAAIDGNNIGESLQRLLAGIGQQIGTFLIATGSAAVAGGILGTAVPIFGAILGGPQAIAAGLGLIAAGGVLAGLSTSLGANASGGGASSSSAPRPFLPSAEPRGFVDGRDGQAGPTTVINVSMGRGWSVGTERGVALEIYEMIRRGLSLSPRALDARFGG